MLQLLPSLTRKQVVGAGIILGIIWCLIAFHLLYGFHELVPWNVSIKPVSTKPGTVIDAFDFSPVESESMKSICSDTQWNETLVFTCENSVGGIGNIRNSVLNCIRYAIEAGAALVIPKIVLRNQLDIVEIRTENRTVLEYMFDKPHFIESLALSCPQLKIYETLNVTGHLQEDPAPIPLVPESLVDRIPTTGYTHPEEWRGLFYTWLESYESVERKGPVIVELGRSYLMYPIYSDGEGFALSFGNILKLRSDVRILASKVLDTLRERYFQAMDPSQPILHGTFFGAHLRTEKDAQEGWPAPDWVYSRYETQSRLYLEQVAKSGLSLIYVASGDVDEVAKFVEDAREKNATVTTKLQLLEEDDLETLKRLSWDQQAMVDFLVLHKVGDFAGIGHSSFAWNIALKRHQYATTKDYLNGPQMLSDELSQIYGIPRGYPEYASCLWP